MEVKLSRRSMLMISGSYCLAGVSANAVLGRPAMAQTLKAQPDSIGFCGPDMVQLVLHDGAILQPAPIAVVSGDDVNWREGSQDRNAGQGVLNGEAGAFSGNRNRNAGQIFTPWAQEMRELALSEMRGDDAIGDVATNWRVSVDGQNVAVQDVFRKTVPIQGARLGPRAFVHSRRHLVTLKLAKSVPNEAEVVVSGPGGLSLGVASRVGALSQAIHICQQGYALDGPKKAYVGLWLGHNTQGMVGSTDAALAEGPIWELIALGSGAVVATGSLTLAKSATEPHRKDQNFNGCDVYEADFTAVAQAGDFRLEVAGIGASDPFEITQNPYLEGFRLAARWYYHQRSGCAITAPYGEGRTRPRNGHPADGLTVWQTDVKLGDTSEGYKGGPYAPNLMRDQPIGRDPASVGQPIPPGAPNPDAWGGWHDAGDWDRRIQHMLAVYDMANIVAIFPKAGTIALNLPETGKAFADPAVLAKIDPTDTGDGQTVLPDLIHEALWGISLWRRTQGPNGEIIGGVEYGSDGIAGSVSWNPIQQAYAYTYEPWAAYRFAHAAARLGDVISTVCGDQVLGARLIAQAEAAWLWAEGLWQKELSVTEGAIPDAMIGSDLLQARVAAAGTLYRANGRRQGCAVFEAHNPFLPRSILGGLGTRREIQAYSAVDYVKAAEAGRPVDPIIVAAISKWISGRSLQQNRMGHDYGLHSTGKYPWGKGWFQFGPGSNWRATEFGSELALGVDDTAAIRAAAIEGLWFALGCNPSNVSFVQGLGRHPFADPFLADVGGNQRVPGHVVLGVCAGQLRDWERDRVGAAIHPAEQDDWPAYAQIFEAKTIIPCAEFGIRSNALRWLFANALVTELM
ncbi:MAG: endoglucanase [Yoonia sp.]|jgi:endoglucanase